MKTQFLSKNKGKTRHEKPQVGEKRKTMEKEEGE